MSEENVEIIRRGYEHWKATGEIRAHPDFVWDVSKLGWPDQQIYLGAEGANQFNAEWADAWDGWEVQVEDYIEAEESVVAMDVPGRTGDPDADVREPGRRPRSRGAVGVAANWDPQLPFVTVVGTNQFKNGMHVEVDGTVFKIVDFQHVKPGKGGAFVRTKLKRAQDGAVIDRTFRAGEKFRPVRTETRRMQYLYTDGTDAHFMDTESYEQLAIPEETVSESLKWIVPNEEVDLLYVDDAPGDVQVPSAVELSVTETQPGMKGDTASGGGDKPATLESGVVVRVPLFVNEGDRVRVDTRSGEYVSRA